MNKIEIQYIFRLGDDKKSDFTIELDEKSLEALHCKQQDALPDWTRLEYQQCAHCPLQAETVPHCPVAVCLSNVIDKFDDVVSYDKVDLEVITDSRTITQHTTAQKSISSLLGLMFATSGCPHTSFFKPMARFHLPLASPQETVFRATSMYLLAQYFSNENRQSAELELEGLKTIYSNLNILNLAIAKRINTATKSDSTKNAIVILDMLANAMPIAIDEHLGGIQHLFDSYLQHQS